MFLLQGEAGAHDISVADGLGRYLEAMRRDGTWADHLILAATSLMLGVDIQLISSVGLQTMISPPEEVVPHDRVVMTMGYLANQHFLAAESGTCIQAVCDYPEYGKCLGCCWCLLVV